MVFNVNVADALSLAVTDLLGVVVVLLEQVMTSEVAPLKEQAEGQLHGEHEKEPLYE